MKSYLGIIVAIGAIAAGVAPAIAGISNIGKGEHRAEAGSDSSHATDSNIVYDVSPSWNDPRSASDGSTSTSRLDVFTGEISHAYSLTRISGAGTFSRAFSSTKFIIDEDRSYSLSGTFTDSDGYAVLFGVSLFDETTGEFLLQNTQESTGPGYTSFTLGEEGGNLDNVLKGRLTGKLVAGHSYEFISEGNIEGYFDGGDDGGGYDDKGSSAEGKAKLALGPVIVPAPSALALAFLAVPLLRSTRRLA